MRENSFVRGDVINMNYENFETKSPSANASFNDAKIVSSEALLGMSKVLYIQHGEELYRLSKTRNGKLILNK
jgi:hemin uptake protein HemP